MEQERECILEMIQSIQNSQEMRNICAGEEAVQKSSGWSVGGSAVALISLRLCFVFGWWWCSRSTLEIQKGTSQRHSFCTPPKRR